MPLSSNFVCNQMHCSTSFAVPEARFKVCFYYHLGLKFAYLRKKVNTKLSAANLRGGRAKVLSFLPFLLFAQYSGGQMSAKLSHLR